MEYESHAPESVSAEAPAPNLIQRVVLVVGAPTKLGEALRKRSPWFWTLAIVAVISTIIVLITPADLLRQAAEAQMAGRQQGAQAPSIGVMRGFGAAGALLGSFVAAAVIAGVLYLVFNVILGQGETTYRQHLSATSHAFWVSLIGGLLLFGLQLAKRDVQLRLGLGLLLPEAPSSFFGRFLNNITIFGVWASVALGAVESGISGGRVSMGQAVGAVIALYLLWGAGLAGIATAFG